MIDISDLLRTADRLAGADATEADLRRSVSTSYYAVFHLLCRAFGELVERSGPEQFQRAWLQTYRYLDHGPAKQKCLEAKIAKRGFPSILQEFANTFIELQDLRIAADYDPMTPVDATLAQTCVAVARQAIADFDAAPADHRRAFVLFVCLRPKGR
jgi:hypothetical protein